MRTLTLSIAASLCLLTPFSAHAQLGLGGMNFNMGGGAPSGPRLGGALAKLFAENNAFTASMEMQTKEPGSTSATIAPGKLSFLQGKTRFEMDIGATKGAGMPQVDPEQLKAMGMDKAIVLTRPDKKLTHIVFPGMSAYIETAMKEEEAASFEAKSKVESTELSKETVDGHPCIKNKTVVTDDKGNKQEATVWNAPDVKNFPIKIEYVEDGKNVTLIFRDVKFSKPEATVFDTPAGFTRYTGMMQMIQGVMMKQLSGGVKDK